MKGLIKVPLILAAVIIVVRIGAGGSGCSRDDHLHLWGDLAPPVGSTLSWVSDRRCGRLQPL